MPDIGHKETLLRVSGVLFLAGLICLLAVDPMNAGEYRDVTPESRLSFPGDYYFRPDYRVQWWYFTGHLFDKDGHEFGYELTFFVVGVQKRRYESKFGVNNIHISHFALTDVAGRRYLSSEKSDSGAYGFAGADDRRLKVWVDRNSIDGSPDRMHLRASGNPGDLDLVLTPLKPVVLHGDKGYSRKSEESALDASMYFSVTDLQTSGTLKMAGKVIDVKGRSWFDREISAGRKGGKEKGWDWFGIQLDDGREIMLYLMRNRDGTIDRSSSGTLVQKDGSYRHLRLDDFMIRASGEYTSARTAARYPARWEIRIPSEGLQLKVTPLLQDQEFIATRTTGNYYWEGSCGVEGTAKGRAYAELTGY
ncbi:MAG: hypothetical protein M0024_06960 [Nitrospiraceae bacterium]|nr:hypothetical protein [Nitrospiraceae bacterium]